VFTGGTVRFAGAGFLGGQVSFDHAEFTGAGVEFTNVRRWKAPPAFPWGTPPSGVKLPEKEDQSLSRPGLILGLPLRNPDLPHVSPCLGRARVGGQCCATAPASEATMPVGPAPTAEIAS